jgi:hypothetical protein
MIEDRGWANPAFWAAYTLVGDGSATASPPPLATRFSAGLPPSAENQAMVQRASCTLGRCLDRDG